MRGPARGGWKSRIVQIWRSQLLGFAVSDLMLSALALAIAVPSVLTGNPDEGPLGVTLPVAIAMSLALIWRTRVPVISAALVTAAGLTQTIVAVSPGSLWALVVLIIVMYSVAAYYHEGIAAVIGIVMLVMLLIEERIDNGPDYVFIAILFGGTWLLGRASRLWRGRIRTVQIQQTQLAELAVADERLRIARELHDTLAHSLSVIAVQAEAAGAVLDHDPMLVREPLQAITASARRSLHEIREVVHQLRYEDDDTKLRPLVGLAGLDELIDNAHKAGVQLQTKIELGADELAPAVDRAAYRIIQEALTNVVKHAPQARACLSITRGDRQLEIVVTNEHVDGPAGSTGSGVGLIGIKERVHALGGSLEVGERADGSFRIRVQIPWEGAAG